VTPESGAEKTGTIVVGIDGSDQSIAAAHWAAEQARLTGSTLFAVGAWEGFPAWGTVVPVPEDYDPVADIRAMVDRIVEGLAAEFPAVTIDTKAVTGPPAEVLIEASRHADLLVVGSRGHNQVSGLLLGSVSQHCATRARCSVVIVRNDGGAT
jgi:nucleotide-binding universal stress UspA family protein